MAIPTKDEARTLLHQCVTDEYQRFHAEMVAAAMAGYARKWDEDELLWWLTGCLHDIDYDQYPNEHPGPSLQWFAEWGYPPELIHAVEAHAKGFNGFTTQPETKLAKTLLACDEICGIFYAYQKLNPHSFYGNESFVNQEAAQRNQICPRHRSSPYIRRVRRAGSRARRAYCHVVYGVCRPPYSRLGVAARPR